MRFAIELMHIALGIATALVMASMAAWAVPLARADIWNTDYVVIAFVIGMGYLPLRQAWAADRAAEAAEARGREA